MDKILNKIDNYLSIQEEKDIISISLKKNNIKDIIEIIRESNDKDKVISKLNEDTKEEVKKLIEGGIL